MSLVRRQYDTHSYYLQVMIHTLYEEQYDSLPRDGQVYNPEKFPTFF